jgi:hypothetical protein
MVGFHDLAGIPCTAHRELLRDLLRDLWGFDGIIVSDYTAILDKLRKKVHDGFIGNHCGFPSYLTSTFSISELTHLTLKNL